MPVQGNPSGRDIPCSTDPGGSNRTPEVHDRHLSEISIEGLEHVLDTITLEKAAYIWNELLPPLMRFLHGRYQTATHQTYDNANTYEGDSELCETLKTYPWIPVGSDNFRRPSECTIAEMCGELRRNEELAGVLGLKPDPNEAAQETQEMLIAQAGFPKDVAAILVENREAITLQVILEVLAARGVRHVDRPEFPDRPVPNPERREAGVRRRTSKADTKAYDQRKRSVRASGPQVPPKVWLREMYTNSRGVTVCQICKEAMPFCVPSTGEYYFEAVQVADTFAKEDHCLYFALCPLCAAKYTVLVKRDDDRLSEFIWAIEQASPEDRAVPVQLAGDTTSVRFVETHLLDLKTALAECLP